MTPPTSTDAKRFTLREARPEDAEACARIVYDAFASIHDHHRFPRDFPVPDAAVGMMSAWVPHPGIWGVVAETGGRIVGSNFLDERDPIRGVGPITVDPSGQNSGVGRRLMEAVIDRGKDAPGIRLVQDGFHMRSLSLYRSLGFDVTDSCVVMSGKPRSGPVEGVEVRPLAEQDIAECEALCKEVHGFARTGALRDATQFFEPVVAVRDGRIAAYATTVSFWQMGYGVAVDEDAMKAMLLGAGKGDEPVALLVPLRSGLHGWALEEGMRAVKPLNVMARGEYREPRGS